MDIFVRIYWLIISFFSGTSSDDVINAHIIIISQFLLFFVVVFSQITDILKYHHVWGGSINYIADKIGDHIIWGFDSFEGLPEGWLPGYQQGKFNENGNLPAVNDNVRLVKGWFHETLPKFMEAHKSEPCSFINIDCDLYSSTKCVLSLLKDNIRKGTVICFDELAGQIGWQDDEYKALTEFAEETGLKFKYIACAFGGGHQLTERVAIEIL